MLNPQAYLAQFMFCGCNFQSPGQFLASMSILVTEHERGFTAGLFSNCSVRLSDITRYVNEHKNFPKQLCSKKHFRLYQEHPELDVPKRLFLERDEIQIVWEKWIDFHPGKQFTNYKLLPFEHLCPLVEKYFTPAPAASKREAALIRQYGLDFTRTIGVLYRGNDKITETEVPPYSLVFQKARELLKYRPRMRFLVQTDELEFREEFCAMFPNSIYFETLPPIPRDATRAITPPATNRIGFAIELLAAIRCLSRTSHLITGSGNVDLWTVLFRGHSRNAHQSFNGYFFD